VPGASRLVVLVGVGISMAVDPLPPVTSGRDIRVLAVGLDGAAIDDPGAHGGETPAESAAATLAARIREELDDAVATAGLVAYRGAGDVALRATVLLEDSIDRLVLVAVPAPGTPLDKDELGRTLESLTAKTLILNGQQDPAAAAADARWYKERIGSSRVEVVPGEGALPLPDVWDRALSHTAPGAKRR
jgi:pimeloyl-ACP methyl ester carboxylesterase